MNCFNSINRWSRKDDFLKGVLNPDYTSVEDQSLNPAKAQHVQEHEWNLLGIPGLSSQLLIVGEAVWFVEGDFLDEFEVVLFI